MKLNSEEKEEPEQEETISMMIEEMTITNEEINLAIPKNIFQTHKSITYINSKPSLLKAVNSWVKHKSSYSYFLYSDEMCDAFMKKHFFGKVYEAYCRLSMAVMKADLWRYCVIYKYGGIYSDTDAICNMNPNIFTNSKTLLICAPENDGDYLCQWCFAAPKNSPILASIINLSVERILSQQDFKGEHIIHYLTGPECFTDGIEKYLQENQQPIFENKIQYEVYRNSIMCIFNAKNFHKNLIHHLFAGSEPDGWKAERYIKLM